MMQKETSDKEKWNEVRREKKDKEIFASQKE